MLQVVAKCLQESIEQRTVVWGGTNSHYFLSEEWSWYWLQNTNLLSQLLWFYLEGSHENSTVSFSVTTEQFGWMNVDKRGHFFFFFFEMQSPPINKIFSDFLVTGQISRLLFSLFTLVELFYVFLMPGDLPQEIERLLLCKLV